MVTMQLMEQYRKHQPVTDRWQMKKLRTQADDLLTMWTAIDEQRALWQLDAGVERQLSSSELAAKSARRVGLEVPDDLDYKQEASEQSS